MLLSLAKKKKAWGRKKKKGCKKPVGKRQNQRGKKESTQVKRVWERAAWLEKKKSFQANKERNEEKKYN